MQYIHLQSYGRLFATKYPFVIYSSSFCLSVFRSMLWWRTLHGIYLILISTRIAELQSTFPLDISCLALTVFSDQTGLSLVCLRTVLHFELIPFFGLTLCHQPVCLLEHISVKHDSVLSPFIFDKHNMIELYMRYLKNGIKKSNNRLLIHKCNV